MKWLLIFAVFLAGCTIPDQAIIGVAERSVNLTAWGINATTPYGLINVGYLQYQRNPRETLQPSKPGIPQPTIP